MEYNLNINVSIQSLLKEAIRYFELAQMQTIFDAKVYYKGAAEGILFVVQKNLLEQGYYFGTILGGPHKEFKSFELRDKWVELLEEIEKLIQNEQK
jgi:hypothetical protein